jgi:hypothetical protein
MLQHLRAAGMILLGVSAGCWSGQAYGQWAQYFQRTDTITMSAGNAKEVNSTIHIIDPWPPYVGNRRIPANGARMTGAIQRYQLPQAAAPQTIPGGLTPVPAYSPGSVSINPSTNSNTLPPP